MVALASTPTTSRSSAARAGDYVDLCLECAVHCLRVGQNPRAASSPEHQELLRRCSQLLVAPVSTTRAAASIYQTHVCRECADICAFCAADCERQAASDFVMRQAAQTCRRCAEFCEKLAA